MDLQAAIRERRSIRKFTDKPVDKALLESLLKEALWGPSGVNRQPWKFVVLRGEAFKKFLAFSGDLADVIDANLAEENFNDKMRTLIHGYFKGLGGATTAVACLYKTSSSYLADHANLVSSATVMYNFTLLAHEAGLGTCWMTGHVNDEERLLKLLGVEGYRLVGLSPVGYPDQEPPVPPRKHEDIVWLE